ncbi:hypothetical protein THRCLA_11681 [Thraustotheca clavata]|uniref:Uncharacterized protein n=1 Tax=Thraustotheca clavata TaxID=74557 RepID=A0A1V9Y716_9STRA|nr:hypothetical protein THRCLA_11681 [Thraustotheca clavata]
MDVADMPQSPGALALSKTFSPKLGGNKTKATSILMFFDRDAIAYASGVAHGIDCYEEYLVIFTLHHLIICDINGKTTTRLITPEDLQRSTPSSIEMLPSGFMAIGCSDGKVRVWSMRLSKVCHTIDTGVPRELGHLVLIPSTKDTTQSSSNVLFHSYNFHCFLATINVEGKAIIWSLHHLDSEFQQSRATEFDTKQIVGFLEVKLLREDGAIAAITKDGHVLFWDISFLLSSRTKPKDQRVVFNGGFFALPTTTKPTYGALIVGSSKNNYVYISCFQTHQLILSDMHSKGKATTPDQDICLQRNDVIKDVRNLNGKVPKKVKVYAIAQCPRDTTFIGCATNHGLLMLKLHVFKPNVAVMIPKLPAIVLSTNTNLRMLPLAEKGKKELYTLKYTSKDSIPLLQKHPTEDMLLVSSASGTNFELVKIAQEANSGSMQYQTITYGPAQGAAWHTNMTRYALLTMNEIPQRRTTRSVSAAVPTESPRRKLGFFGKTEEIPVATGPQLSYFFKNDVKAVEGIMTSASLYDVVNGVSNIIIDKLTFPNPIIHLFSGPLLGVVYCVLPEDKPIVAPLSPSSSTPRAKTIDSSSTMGTEDTASVKIYVEFYNWSQPQYSTSDEANSLRKVGPTFASPLLLEWEKSNTFCAMIYPKKFIILRAQNNGAVLQTLHKVATPRPIISALWVHQTLFTATEDDIKCYFFCGTRVFSFVLASLGSFNESSNPMNIAPAELPIPQQHPGGYLKLLGVHQEQLYMTGPHQRVYSIDLKNEVLQFCMYVAQGNPNKALALVPHISLELSDWLASFLDAFGFGTMAISLSSVSVSMKANLCIKHDVISTTLVELFPSICDAPDAEDSSDILGGSLLQQCASALVRNQQIDACLAQFAPLMIRRRFNDALFIAIITKQKTLMSQVLSVKKEWSLAAFNDPSNEILNKWHHALVVDGTKHDISIRPADVANAWR